MNCRFRLFALMIAALAALVLAPTGAKAGEGAGGQVAWQLPERFTPQQMQGEEWVRPQRYQALVLNRPLLKAALDTAPLEGTARGRTAPLEILIPMPDGSFQRFSIVESPVMEPALAAKYPQIKTYAGFGLDDPYATIRLDDTPQGFHSQVLSPLGAAYIDPFTRGDDSLYTAYWKQDLVRPGQTFSCGTFGPAETDKAVRQLAIQQRDGLPPALSTGPTMRIYRLACSATGEFTAFHGGTVAGGLAAVTTMVNRITGVYEADLAVRLTLVANNDQIIYTDAVTDPFTSPNSAGTSNTHNQASLDAAVPIGSANYDVGHVVHRGSNNGLAGLNVVCSNGNKARGYTSVNPPTGDVLAIDYAAHELGHQFGGRHNFNSCGGSQGDSSSLAVEPGSGSTIMSYAGICGASHNLQANSDAMFNSINIEQMTAFVAGATGGSCDNPVATGNSAPSVNPGPNYVIPKQTPFTLTASAIDPDSDPLTYSWEERPPGSAAVNLGVDNGSNPICRPWPPTPDPSRTVPRLSNLLANSTAPGEILPQIGRSMRWRVVVRDNRGGVDIQPTGTQYVTLTVSGTSGPFAVTSPNTATALNAGPNTVTWNVSNTSNAPVNCASVDILLSTDGGNTFPTLLAAAVPNNGSASVNLPGTETTLARIKVAAVGNIFFDISNANFTIAVPTDGACCDPDGSCTIQTEANCTVEYKGNGTVCSPNPCTQPTGACCHPNGTCSILTSAECPAASTYVGNQSACDPDPCPIPTGACCDDDGTCLVLQQFNCNPGHGTYQGHGTTCNPNICVGACCATDGTCAQTTQAACSDTYQGGGTVCSPNPCPQPTGACCSPAGSCSVATAIGCAAIQGTYFGDASVCAEHPCEGACCTGSLCALTSNAAACSGFFAGPDTLCNAPGNQTTPCCRADFNGSGSVTVQDLFDYLAEWFAGTFASDFNGLDSVTVQDLFDYLAAWFARC